MEFQDIIDQFNDGEFDAEVHFGDYNTFFTFLNKTTLHTLKQKSGFFGVEKRFLPF